MKNHKWTFEGHVNVEMYFSVMVSGAGDISKSRIRVIVSRWVGSVSVCDITLNPYVMLTQQCPVAPFTNMA